MAQSGHMRPGSQQRKFCLSDNQPWRIVTTTPGPGTVFGSALWGRLLTECGRTPNV